MTASVVINTCNRARSLERLLPSLRQLDGARFEVVVVNGPSTDDTEAVLAAYGGRVKVARCPTANLSRSRNIGIAAAAGDVVVFIDDDALPADADWLRKLVEVFERDIDRRIGAAGGATLHRDTEWTEFAGGWTSDYAEQLFSDQPLPDGADPSRWCRRTVGNNSAFRRSALVAIGGFDEHFVYYLDEADVCLRLVRAGYSVVYRQDCPVRHYPAASPHGAPFIRNRRLIARSDTYYCLKNGADSWPRRLVETLRRAPHKHFVRELPGLVAEGQIDRTTLQRLKRQWFRGLAEGVLYGLCAPRATRVLADEPPAFVPFDTGRAAHRLSVCLLSRRVPPDPHAGGVGRYTFDLARGLHDLGHRVTVITEGEATSRREGLAFEVVGIAPAEVPGGLQQTPVLAHNLSYAEAVASSVDQLTRQRGAFDVVHASNWGLEGLGLAQRREPPLVVMLVTPLESVMAAEGWSPSLDLTANIELDRWIIAQATRVVAPSGGVVDSYGRREDWDGRAVSRVPLGIVCQPTGRAERTGAADGPRKLLFVGRLERRKGVHVLLEVLPRLLERHPGWQCDLVGNASVPLSPGVTFQSAFDAQHGHAPWRPRVAFHGALSDDDVQRFYREADLFVAPSLFESFGLIYLEAMQYGVPVVGCAVGGVPEVVRHGEHGLLVPPGDGAALEAALDRLMADDDERARMGARAKATVREGGSHVAMAERMLVEYEAAIDAHRAQHGFVSHQGHEGGRTGLEVHAPRSVVGAAIDVLESVVVTKEIGLVVRASAALERGLPTEAAELLTAALGVTPHPEYFAMAVDLALAADDRGRALDLAARGFDATRDDSDACVTCAAVLLGAGASARAKGWEAWWRARGDGLAVRAHGAAVTAVRRGRDASAIALFEACLALPVDDERVHAQARYHLGSALKRRGRLVEARTQFARLLRDDAASSLTSAVLAALHFHLGELDVAEGRLPTACAHFDACLALNPAHNRARVRLAEATSFRADARNEPTGGAAPAA